MPNSTEDRDNKIKDCLHKLSRKMDWVEMDPVMREYLDIQVTKIHRLISGTDHTYYDKRESELLRIMED